MATGPGIYRPAREGDMKKRSLCKFVSVNLTHGRGETDAWTGN